MLQEFFSFLCGFLYLNGFVQMIYNSWFISGFDRIMSFKILSAHSIDVTVEMYFNFMHELNHLRYSIFHSNKKRH